MMNLEEIREELKKYKLTYIAEKCEMPYKKVWHLTKISNPPYENVKKVSDFLENLKDV